MHIIKLAGMDPNDAVTLCVLVGKDGSKVHTVVATRGKLLPGNDQEYQEVAYTDLKVIGNGSFGVVYSARMIDTNEPVAIKKVLQDKRFKVSSCFPLLFSSR